MADIILHRDTATGKTNAINPSRHISFVIDGGGSAIAVGMKGYVGPFPFPMNVKEVHLQCDVSGQIEVDILKHSHLSGILSSDETISSGSRPGTAGSSKYHDANLSSWVKTISSGDIIGFNVTSAETVTKCTVGLWLQ